MQERGIGNGRSGRYRYLGIGASSEWMELGAGDGGYDLRGQLTAYANVEAAGGGRYYCGPDRRVNNNNNNNAAAAAAAADASSVLANFSNTLTMAPLNEEGFWVPPDEERGGNLETQLTARQALDAWEATQLPPLCRWQVHLFAWE